MHKSEALCVMIFVSYVCVSVRAHLLFSVEPADESCHIKDKGQNQFYWSRQFILLGLPNIILYTISMHTGWSLDF